MTSLQDIGSPAIAVEAAGDSAVTVTIHGELDLATAPVLSGRLEQAVARHCPRSLAFDLADVGFLDCAAAHVLIEATRALPGSPPPVLRHPVFAVRRVLSVTGLDAQCIIEP
jgi:anti-sigma B factor antagonist